MAARRRYIDPATGDYAITRGGFREDMTPASKVVLRLRTRRGSVPGLPEFGSRLHSIRAITPGVETKARAFVLEALSDLVADGQLPGLAVSVSVSGSALYVQVSYRDPASVVRVIPYSYRVAA